ncbi:hypothetical protein ACP70R_019343 [Stipagrostis hirtigluma subsp. patula]
MSRGAAATDDQKPVAHAVFFPFPAQGHVAPALHLAKLLHLRGAVRITFVHTDRNRRRLLRSRGPAALSGSPGFHFAAVPDGLPPGEVDDDDHSPQHIAALLSSIKASVPHLKHLLDDAAASGAPATCIVSDIEWILLAAREVGLPAVALWTTSACAFMAFLQCQQLVDRGIVPLRDAEQLTNGYLDSTVIDWMPGMPADMRLRDMVSFVRTADPDDPMLRTVIRSMRCLRTNASAVVVNTFDGLEGEVVAALSAALPPPVYTVGPLQLLAAEAVAGSRLDAPGANLFREDDGCLRWLGSRRPRSVVYANFGSIAVLTSKQLVELAMGLANSGYAFLMVIRDDLAKGAGPNGVLPPSFIEETKDQGYITSWCPQAAVLRHEAVGAFLTHCGWNSVLESISSGVPMLCWPFAADQQTNCRFVCTEWRVGVEISDDFERGEVEARVREVMDGEKGSEMRQRAAELRDKAAATASQAGGPSWVNIDRLVSEVFHNHKKQLD